MRDAGTQYLNLDTRYHVGIRSFDEQHYHILVVIDKLFDAIDNKKEQIVISPILEDFITQIKNHFTCEENLMSSIDYPAFLPIRSCMIHLCVKYYFIAGIIWREIFLLHQRGLHFLEGGLKIISSKQISFTYLFSTIIISIKYFLHVP